jgi:hypothetical protein
MDTLTIYVKTKLASLPLFNAAIYVNCKQIPSNQLLLTFSRIETKTYMNICYFEKYLKIEEKAFEISSFGKSDDIVTTLLKFQIKSLYKGDNDLEFNVAICHRTEDPNLVNSTIYRLPRGGYNLDECPICNVNWRVKNPINLPCNHKVCCDCMLSLVKNDTDTCPVCRGPFL